MRRPSLRDPDVADAIRAERRDESTHHTARFSAAHAVDDDAEMERAGITDEQIRGLYADGSITGVDLHIATRNYFGAVDTARDAERARCAEILNARSAK